MNDGWAVEVRQQPKAARASSSDRRPIDPVIILQLRHRHRHEILLDRETSTFFCFAQLYEVMEGHEGAQPSGQEESIKADRALTGTMLSSLFMLKDPSTANTNRGAFFVFPDLSVRSEGLYQLHFTVFGVDAEDKAFFVTSCRSSNFRVYSAKRFPGMSNSTELSRAFADQGLKIRIRKEARPSRKRPRDGSHDSGGEQDMVEREQDVRDSQAWQQAGPAPSWQPPLASTSGIHSGRVDDGYGHGGVSNPLYAHPYVHATPQGTVFAHYNFPDYGPRQHEQHLQQHRLQYSQHLHYMQPNQQDMHTANTSRMTLPPLGNVIPRQDDAQAGQQPSTDPYGRMLMPDLYGITYVQGQPSPRHDRPPPQDD
jgi:hypothetical protein